MTDKKKGREALTDAERLQNVVKKINTLLDALKPDSASAICLRGVLAVTGSKRTKKEQD